MRAQKEIDFNEVDWSKIDKEKAEFICKEGAARLDAIHKGYDAITARATGMLSFSMSALTALTGFFVTNFATKLEALFIPLFAMSICAWVFLFAILILLLFILIPKGLSSAQGSPSAYLTGGYYHKSMENIIKGNIQPLHESINKDDAIHRSRVNLYRTAVVLFATFPVISAGVWAVGLFFL
jgi:hypothetical protein